MKQEASEKKKIRGLIVPVIVLEEMYSHVGI
jgi:hypothetical protein